MSTHADILTALAEPRAEVILAGDRVRTRDAFYRVASRVDPVTISRAVGREHVELGNGARLLVAPGWPQMRGMHPDRIFVLGELSDQFRTECIALLRPGGVLVHEP
jgi:hypothetical protein